MPNRHRSHWPLIGAALISLPVLYIAGFGPALRLAQKIEIARTPVGAIYWPLGQIASDPRNPFHAPLTRIVVFCTSYTGMMGDGGVNSYFYAVPVSPNGPWGTTSRTEVETLPPWHLRFSRRATILAIEEYKRIRDGYVPDTE